MDLPFRVDLSGKVAVLTGGGGVLGGVMAQAIAACGAKVAVLSRKLENAQAVANEITGAGHTAEAWSCDVTEHAQLVAVERQIAERLGPCDILVNAAGGNDPRGTVVDSFLDPQATRRPGETARDFFDLDPAEMQQLMHVNYAGTVLATHVFAHGMVERRRGNVLNISSMAAFTPLTRIPTYSSAKAAVSNFTQWLAVHLARTGVRVNALAPGFFITRQNYRNMCNADGSPTARGERVLAHTPMQRYGQPEELIGATLWLVSDQASSFVTGTIIPIDGGFHAMSV